jgi:hypothetical protein
MCTAYSRARRATSCAPSSPTSAASSRCGSSSGCPRAPRRRSTRAGCAARWTSPTTKPSAPRSPPFVRSTTATSRQSPKKILDLLSASVHERNSPERDEAIAALRGPPQWTKDALARGIGFGIVCVDNHQQRAVDPEAILDAYFHGHYLHSGNDLAEDVRRLDALGPWARYTLYNVVRELTKAY